MKISRNQTPDTMHPREDMWAAGPMAALNAELIVDSDGSSVTTVRLLGTFVGTFVLEGQTETSTWDLIPVRNLQGGAYQVSMTTIGGFVANTGMYRRTRLRCIAYTSGSATTYMQSSSGALDQSLSANVTPLIIHAAAAVGLANTLTLPAPGVGLRQYITYLRISRFATALLTAGVAPVLVTSANIPGAPLIAFPADAAPQGNIFPYQEDYSQALMASAQNTAVTIVMPATPLVIWRGTVGYYVAP